MRELAMLVLIAALGCGSKSGSEASEEDQMSANTPSQTESESAPESAAEARADNSSFSVRVVGQGPPMVLLPGLASPDAVWDEAVARYRDRYELHLFTLAGFAGQPGIEAPFLGRFATDIAAYIQERGLERPIVMGHSLGGFLAFAIASSIPDGVGPVIVLDGAPYGPALANPEVVPAAVTTRATMVRARAQAATGATKEMMARQMFTPMFSREADLERILPGVLKSESRAVGQAIYELMTTDLRPKVAAIRSPLLLVVPGERFEDEDEPDLSLYQAQLRGIPEHEIFIADGAKHFVMIDEPDTVYGEVDRFLAAHAGGAGGTPAAQPRP